MRTKKSPLWLRILKEAPLTDILSKLISAMMFLTRVSGDRTIFQFDNSILKKEPSKASGYEYVPIVNSEEELINAFAGVKCCKVYTRLVGDEIVIELSNN